MYRHFMPVFFICLFFSLVTSAQVTAPVNKTNAAVANASNAVNATTQTITTATSTINQLRGIFGQKKNKSKDAVTIGIAGIEYEDENLTILHEAIEKISGVKDAKKSMKGGAVTIEVTYKKGADELWDNVPKEKKALFKVSESADNNIILIYKNAKDVAPPANVQDASATASQNADKPVAVQDVKKKLN